MLNNKKTKIICTIGPSSGSVELIKQLISAGMDGARLNFSHGSHSIHEEYIKNIRIASKESGKIITIIQDLSGPKLRIGRIEGGEVEIVSGSLIRISAEEVIGTSNLISTNYPGMIDDVRSGETLLIDDGKLALKVISIDKSIGIIECEVMV